MGGTSLVTSVAAITTDDAQFGQALRRVRAEFLEMPGLKLTAPQVQRLAGVDAFVCARVLEELVMSGLLARGVTGTYRRS